MKRTNAKILHEVTNFALTCHADQVRKGAGTPYILHPLQVANRLGLWGISQDVDMDVWRIALLHDTIEDGAEFIRDKIRKKFGENVLAKVEELTFTPPSDATKEEIAELKAEYMSLFDKTSVEALIVKVSDRLCNVEDFLKTDRKYASKYWDKAHALFEAFYNRKEEIADRFGQHVADAMDEDIWEVHSKTLNHVK